MGHPDFFSLTIKVKSPTSRANGARENGAPQAFFDRSITSHTCQFNLQVWLFSLYTQDYGAKESGRGGDRFLAGSWAVAAAGAGGGGFA
jgi:hypothetical protein